VEWIVKGADLDEDHLGLEYRTVRGPAEEEHLEEDTHRRRRSHIEADQDVHTAVVLAVRWRLLARIHSLSEL